MFRFLRAIVTIVFWGTMGAGSMSATGTLAAPQTGDDTAARLQLDEKPEPFRPKHRRSPQESDRLHAIALYATGCTKQHRGDHQGALRNFQRSWHYDPTAQTVLLDLINLADQLGRNGVSNRYAMKLDITRISDIRQLHRLGLLFYVNDRFDESASAFAKVLSAIETPERFGLRPSDIDSILRDAAQTYRLYGESFLAAGRLDAAEAVFRKADQAKAHRSLYRLNMARIDARRKKNVAALAKLDGYFARPSIPSAGMMPYELLAETLTALGRRHELFERLEKQHRANPDNIALGYYLASSYQRAGRLKTAETQFRKLIDKQPLVDAYTGLAEIYWQEKRAAALLKVLSDFITRSQAADLDDFGDLAESIAGDADLLSEMIDAAGEGNRSKMTVHEALVLAMLHVAAEKWDDAKRYFNVAINAEGASKAKILRNWALDWMMAERFDESAALLRRALKHEAAEGERALTHYILAGVLEYAGQTDAALTSAREAERLRPSSLHFSARTAWVFYHAKQYPQAKQLYRRFLKKHDSTYEPESVRKIVKEARIVMSNICIATNELDEAERWLEEVLDEYPDDIGTLNDLGYLWADRDKQLERALMMVRRAVEAEPENTAYRDSLGWALFRLGRFHDATVELEKAIKSDPDGVMLDHLAEAYHGSNQPAKALAAWRRAVKLFSQQGDDEKRKGVEQKIQRLQTKSDKRSAKESM